LGYQLNYLRRINHNSNNRNQKPAERKKLNPVAIDSNGDNSDTMVNGDKKAFGGSSSIRFGDGSDEISRPLQNPAVSFDQTSNRNHNTKNPPIQRISRLKSRVFLPRLIPRNFPFDQSSNGVQIFNEHKHVIWGLLRRDWFHAMLRIPGWLSLLGIVLVWVLMIFVFAFIYMAIDSSTHNLKKNCGLGEPSEPIQFPAAYAFSLETCTTVGCEYTATKLLLYKMLLGSGAV